MNMGQYIDGLTDEQRDRLVEAQGWNSGTPEDGNRCLVAHAQDVDKVDHGEFGGYTEGAPPFIFDTAVDRFGIDRVVRAIKLRAGTIPTIQVASRVPADAYERE